MIPPFPTVSVTAPRLPARPQARARNLVEQKDEVRFGAQTPSPGAEILLPLLPRLGEATGWEHVTHHNRLGDTGLGYDWIFTLDGKRYAFRAVFAVSDGLLPDGVERGVRLIVDGEKTDVFRMEVPDFHRYWNIVSREGTKHILRAILTDVKANIGQLSLQSLSLGRTGDVRFRLGGRDYQASHGGVDRYLSQELPLSEEELRRDFGEARSRRTEGEPLTLEAYQATRKRRMRTFALDSETGEELFNMIRKAVDADFQTRYGFGPDLDPRPIIREAAVYLLEGRRMSSTFDQGPSREDIIRFPSDNLPGITYRLHRINLTAREKNYRLSIREESRITHSVRITDPHQIRMIDTMMAAARMEHQYEQLREKRNQQGKANKSIPPEEFLKDEEKILKWAVNRRGNLNVLGKLLRELPE